MCEQDSQSSLKSGKKGVSPVTMNTDASTQQTMAEPGRGARHRAAIGIMVGLVTLLQALSLFLAAGRLDWVMGWIYVASLALNQAAAVLVFIWSNPALLADRSRSKEPATWTACCRA